MCTLVPGFDGATFSPGANGDAIVIEVKIQLAVFKILFQSIFFNIPIQVNIMLL
jgi:hypothetical protein